MFSQHERLQLVHGPTHMGQSQGEAETANTETPGESCPGHEGDLPTVSPFPGSFGPNLKVQSNPPFNCLTGPPNGRHSPIAQI